MTMTTIGLRKKQHECVYKYERYECVYNTNVANCYGQDAVQMGYGRLTAKQTAQLIRLCNEFQPCLSFDEIVSSNPSPNSSFISSPAIWCKKAVSTETNNAALAI